MVAILVLLTILTFLTLDHFAQRRALGRMAAEDVGPPPAHPHAAWPDPAAAPPGLFWSPWHTWAHLEPRGAVRVGAGFLPGAALGDVDRVELRPAGTEVRAGETVATLHRGARAVPLRAPVGGVIEATNSRLADAPAVAVLDPLGQGWLCSIRSQHLAAAIRGLRVAEEARDWLRGESRRVCDFLVLLRLRDPARVAVALADGGIPVAGFADVLGESEWNELVRQFFDAENAR
jgi:glycine cleavage system H protein